MAKVVTRSLLTLLLLAPAAARGISLHAVLADGGTGVELAFRATPETTGDPADRRSDTELHVRSGETAALALAGKGAWTLRLDTPGYFAAPTMVASSPPGAGFEVQVWPTAPIAVALEAARDQALPERVTAHFSPSDPNDRRYPSGESDCSVDAKARRVTCEIPSGGPFDLALHARGYVPAYAWDLVHRREAPARPPAWRLTAGGSVAGFVEAAGRDLDPARCTIALEPVVADLQPTDRQETQLEKRGTSVHPNRRGFFQLADVAPGTYRLRARQAGYSEAAAGPVAVAKGEELRFERPLELVRPFELEVDVEPALDAHQKPWRIRLDRARPGSSRITHVCDLATSPQGVATCPGLSPAPYLIRVEDSAGDLWYDDRLDLAGPGAPLWVSLALLDVSGTVTIGDDPFPTGLKFRNPEGNVVIATESDEDGAYAVVLPEKKEPWQVEVGADPDYPVKSFREVELRPVAGAGRKVTADFELPGTELRGRVVDQEQRPATAVVAGHSVDDTFSTRTDEEGNFVVRALTPGPAQIHAQGLAGASDRRSALVSEDDDSPEIVLVLRKGIRFSVRVVAPDGSPVSGASIRWRGLDPAGVPIDADNGATDLRGTFPSQRHAADAAMLFYVEAPGFPLLVHSTSPPSDGQEVTLALGREAGALELVYDAAGGRPETNFTARHPTLSLYWQGIELKYFIFGEWAVLNGEPEANREFPSRVAALPPGHYDACWAEHAERPVPPSPLFGPLAGEQCVGGELAPGGTLTLEVPAFRPPAGSGGAGGDG